MLQATIRDRDNREYDLVVLDETDTHYHVFVVHRRKGIGQAQCPIDDQAGVLTIANIEIFAEVAANRPCLLWFIPWRIWKRLTARRYRGRGLGSALLEHVIAYARSRGLKRIVGQVVAHDLAQSSWLPQWYARHGFQVVRINAEAAGRTAVCISLDLLGSK